MHSRALGLIVILMITGLSLAYADDGGTPGKLKKDAIHKAGTPDAGQPIPTGPKPCADLDPNENWSECFTTIPGKQAKHIKRTQDGSMQFEDPFDYGYPWGPKMVWGQPIKGTYHYISKMDKGVLDPGPAITACQQLGARLPHKEHFFVLMKNFALQKRRNYQDPNDKDPGNTINPKCYEDDTFLQNECQFTPEGRKDFLKVFPEINKKMVLWTASPEAGPPQITANYAYVLAAYYGAVLIGDRGEKKSVMCVKPGS